MQLLITTRQKMYFFLSALAPVAVVFLLLNLFVSDYRSALAFAVCAVLLMEGRVQTGGRVPHTSVFWLHLTAMSIFLFSIISLAFFMQPLWLVGLSWLCIAAGLSTGAVLWWKGLKGILVRAYLT